MAKYRRKLKTRKNLRKKLRKTMRRIGGYSPMGANGGNYGAVPTTYPVGQNGALPDPVVAAGVPLSK